MKTCSISCACFCTMSGFCGTRYQQVNIWAYEILNSQWKACSLSKRYLLVSSWSVVNTFPDFVLRLVISNGFFSVVTCLLLLVTYLIAVGHFTSIMMGAISSCNLCLRTASQIAFGMAVTFCELFYGLGRLDKGTEWNHLAQDRN